MLSLSSSQGLLLLLYGPEDRPRRTADVRVWGNVSTSASLGLGVPSGVLRAREGPGVQEAWARETERLPSVSPNGGGGHRDTGHRIQLDVRP